MSLQVSDFESTSMRTTSVPPFLRSLTSRLTRQSLPSCSNRKRLEVSKNVKYIAVTSRASKLPISKVRLLRDLNPGLKRESLCVVKVEGRTFLPPLFHIPINYTLLIKIRLGVIEKKVFFMARFFFLKSKSCYYGMIKHFSIFRYS